MEWRSGGTVAQCCAVSLLHYRLKQPALRSPEGNCKPCPVSSTGPVCGSDGRNYASNVRDLEHTHTNKHTHIDVYTHVYTHERTQTYTYTHLRKHRCILHSFIHMNTHLHTHIDVYTPIYTHEHAHIHT